MIRLDYIWDYVVIVALVAAWLLMLLYKWGVIEWLQVHGSVTVSKAANCTFCLSWWMCVVVSLAVLAVSGDMCAVLVPVLATPITKRML